MDDESKLFQSHREAFPTTIISVLVCLVQWNDHEGRYLPDPNHFREMWNGESRTVANPGESISHWLQSNSYGKYSVRAEVVDWRRLNQSEAYWANGNMGNSDGDRTIEQAFVPLLEAAGKSGVNLKKFDTDGDGYLKDVVFVHSGFGAELGGTDCYTGASYLDRIISKSRNTDVAIGSTGLRLSNFVTVSAYNNLCKLGPAHIGVHIHEWLHSHFSLSDMYDLGGRYQDSQSAVGGLGAYDIM
jgi:M6 family metalloprotease-like protein